MTTKSDATGDFVLHAFAGNRRVGTVVTVISNAGSDLSNAHASEFCLV